MINDQTGGKLQETLEFARKNNDGSLKRCIDRLNKVDGELGSVTTIFNDFAPKSFEFVRKKEGKFCGNGGIIYHGPHDGYGSGGPPSFSVCVSKTNGWAIHT